MVTYTKHNATDTKKKDRRPSNNMATSFGNYRRTGIPYNPRMTDKERRELMRR